MVKCKICGLRRMEDVQIVNELKPDYAGMILASGFKRSVSMEEARRLKEHLQVPLVGVFYNNTVEEILAYDFVDIIQLHGQETIEEIVELKKFKPVWKVFSPAKTSVEEIEASPCDFVLLDAGTGSGKTFDWSLVKGIKRPFILAGGLTPQNVEQAITITHPYGVDTSSGVETNGVKDKEKINLFIERVQTYETTN